jgi:TonB family protein
MRARLRASEETCCDARVLRAGGSGSVYAQALIKAVEFLQGSPNRLPALATGAFANTSLTKRITMIMLDRPRRPAAPAWRGLFAAGLLALLPLIPARASVVVSPAGIYTPPAPLVAPTAQSGDEPVVSERQAQVLARALELIDAGDLARASTVIAEARGPEASAALDFTAGNVAQMADRLDEAERDYAIAVEKHPTFQRAWKNLAIVRMQLGRSVEAAEAFERTIALGGGDAVSYGLCGSCLLDAGDPRAAESAFWMATLLDPETSEWRLGLLNALFQQRRNAHALTLASQMLEERPDDVQLLLLAANAHVALDQPERAAEQLAIVDALGGATTQSRLLRADLDLRAGRYAQAVEGYRRALTEDPLADRERALSAVGRLAALGERERASRLLALLEDALLPVEARILIAITKDGRVIYSGREIGVQGVRPLVLWLLERAELPVVLRADRDAPPGTIEAVIDEARKGGTLSVSITTTQEGGDDDLRAEVLRLRMQLGSDGGASPDGPGRELPPGLDPRDGNALLELGEARTQAGDYDAALVLYDQAARLEGYALEASLRRVRVLGWMGRPEEAAAERLRAKELAAQIEEVTVVTLPPPPVIEEAVEGEPGPRPRLLYRAAPTVTDELRAKGPGRVTGLFVVDGSGAVVDPRVQESSDPDFEEPALEAVRRWRFLPAVRDGEPVHVRLRIHVDFPGDADPDEARSRADPSADFDTSQSGGSTDMEDFVAQDGIVQPRVVYRAAPEITAELRKHMPAIVWLAFLVDQEGDVASPQVIKSTDSRFERAALAAIKRWRFDPGRRGGEPLVMETRIAIPFVEESLESLPPGLEGEMERLDLEELQRRLAEGQDGATRGPVDGSAPQSEGASSQTGRDDRKTGSIRGVVLDGDFDAPLSACQVTLVETGAQVTTTDQGLFVLESVLPGQYTLNFDKKGYTRQVKADVVVSPGGLTQVTVALTGEHPDMEEFVVEPEEDPVVIAITADGRVIYAGREVGVAGVRPLVERLLVDGDRPVFLKVDGRTDPQLWGRVQEEAALGGATSVDVQLLLAVALADLDSKPRPLYQPAPKLTPELAERAPATVTVIFLLDEGGRVSDPVVESSSDEAFNHAALEAVKTWRFEPGLKDGQPVYVRMRVPITFPEKD